MAISSNRMLLSGPAPAIARDGVIIEVSTVPALEPGPAFPTSERRSRRLATCARLFRGTDMPPRTSCRA